MAETQETRIQQNHRKLTEQGYIPSIYIDYTVEGALEGTPLLIEGAPGVGKTSLAYAVADMMGVNDSAIELPSMVSFASPTLVGEETCGVVQ